MRTFKILKNKTLSSSMQERKASVPWPCWSYILSPSSYTFAGINLITYTFIPLRLGFMVGSICLALQSLVIVQVFHLLWCWFMACGWVLRVVVFHPSSCELTVVRFDAVVWARFGSVLMVKTVRWRGCLNMQSKTYDLELIFVKACSDLLAIHQWKCKEWQKGGFLVACTEMKSLCLGTMY
jgi:hypothetical protein